MDPPFPTLVTLHLSTQQTRLADTHSVSRDAVSLPLSQSITPTSEAIHTANTLSHTLISPPGLQTHQNGHVHLLNYTYFLPPCVSRPRKDVLLDSGSLVLHGQLLYCRGAVHCTLLQNGWRHDPRDLHTRIQNYCGTHGDYRLQYTVHTCVNFWIDMLIIVIATAVHRFACF